MYGWTRFWHDPASEVHVIGGYLAGPHDGAYWNPALVTLADLSYSPCLVLIGEAGLGKSWAVRHEVARLEAAGERAILVDLATVSSDQRLEEVMAAATAGHGTAGKPLLHLFLDALDECAARVPRAATIVINECAKAGTDRLLLRIASRPSAWDGALNQKLNSLFEGDAVAVRRLAPLRRADVAAAAAQKGLDPTEFLDAVERADATMFAGVPLTLEMLMELHTRKQLQKLRRSDLFAAQCRLLLEEHDPERRAEQTRLGMPDAGERLAIAARLAAAVALTTYWRTWPGQADDPARPADAVAVEHLVGGTEPAPRPAMPGAVVDSSLPSVRLVLDSPLFRDAGDGCRRWEHAAYPEFLAAEFLIRRGLSGDDIGRILLQRDDVGELHVSPQLLGVAGWAASSHSEALDLLIETDPEALIRSDVLAADEGRRGRIVEKLLDWFESGRLHDVYGVRPRNVGFPDLDAILRPWICDRDRTVEARRLAVQIAEDNGVAAVVPDLVDVALSTSEPFLVRRDAIRAVATLGGAEDLIRLRRLAVEADNGDSDHELRGAALSAVWPDHLPAEDLFASLVLPPRLFGSYRHFLFFELVPGLPEHALPHALRWIRGLPQISGAVDAFDDLVDAVLARALVQAEDAPLARLTAEAFSAIYLSEGTYRQGSPERALLDALGDDRVRRRLLRDVVPVLGESDRLVWMRMGPPHVLHADDLDWVLERVNEATDGSQAAIWAKVAAYAFDPSRPDHANAVLVAAGSSAALANEFAPFLGTVELGSEQATSLKEEWERWHPRTTPDDALDDGPDPAMRDRVEAQLAAVERDSPGSWWEVDYLLQFDETGYRETSEAEDDITDFPGWRAADEHLKDRFVAALPKYLEVEGATLLENGRLHRPTVAGLRALMFLQRHRPHLLEAMSDDAWRRWALAVVALPFFGEHLDSLRAIVAVANGRAPDELCAALSQRLDRELASDDGRCHSLHLLSGLVDPAVDAVVLSKLDEAFMTMHGTHDLLWFLLGRDNEEAFTRAEGLVAGDAEPGGASERAVVAGALLLGRPDRPQWESLWARFVSDREFGRRVVLRFAAEHHDGLQHFRFSEDQLARLYGWLVEQFPFGSDPDDDAWVTVGTQVSWLRDGLLTALARRGTPAAVKEVSQLVERLPQHPWLQRVLINTRTAAREKVWAPMALSDVLALRGGAIVVRTAEDLMKAVVDELGRVQEELKGATPSARDLWDRVGDGVYRPIGETEMSDWLARRLKQGLNARGIVVNREVEVRRRPGAGMGTKVDLLVNASPGTQDGSEVVTLPIEVKGCWHPEVLSALHQQLIVEYVDPIGSYTGLYLVVWFHGGIWDSSDRRRKFARLRPPDLLLSRLRSQADEARSYGNAIEVVVLDASLPP